MNVHTPVACPVFCAVQWKAVPIEWLPMDTRAPAMPRRRRWFELDPFRTLELLGVVLVALAVLTAAHYRRFLASLPEPSRVISAEEMAEYPGPFDTPTPEKETCETTSASIGTAATSADGSSPLKTSTTVPHGD